MTCCKALSGVRVLTQRKTTEAVSTKAETRTVMLTLSLQPSARWVEVSQFGHPYNDGSPWNTLARLILFPASTRKHSLYRHARTCRLVSIYIVEMCHVLTNVPTEIQVLKMVGYFPAAWTTTSVSTHYVAVQTCRVVLNVDDVFKRTT